MATKILISTQPRLWIPLMCSDTLLKYCTLLTSFDFIGRDLLLASISKEMTLV